MSSHPEIPIRCRSVLILGGARSGKSGFAQSLAESTAPNRLFLATAQAGDDEMAARIARHRADRHEGWTTREEPLELVAALRAEARPDRVVLVDCVTLWLSNLIFSGRDMANEVAELRREISILAGPTIFVSNEVGLGIAPATPLGREFRDCQGRANQDLAEACDAVVFIAAGAPLVLKPAPRPRLKLS
jgi:adenosylcobinamide kinase/adenosylcobinamide-phosphate guanylyltransferase